MDETPLPDLDQTMDNHSKEKRASNRRSSLYILSTTDIAYSVLNNGAHILIMEHAKLTIDFWPGTGLWHVRFSPSKGRGIYNLINYINDRRKKECRSPVTIAKPIVSLKTLTDATISQTETSTPQTSPST